MPEKKVERVSKYNLSGASEDTYASQTAQNPTTARRAKSLFPSPAGYLERENPNATFATGALPSGVVWLFEFDQTNFGVVTRYYFAATAAKLYLLMGAPGVGTWSEVTQVGALANTPVAVSINNKMHFSDGVTSWLFDGTNWVTDGLPIPLHAPENVVGGAPPAQVNITAIERASGIVGAGVSSIAGYSVGMLVTVICTTDPSFNGTFVLTAAVGVGPTLNWNQDGVDANYLSAAGHVSVPGVTTLANRFYWTTESDSLPNALPPNVDSHESTSSPRSSGIGVVTNKIIKIHQRAGTVTGSAPNGTITSVQDAQHLTCGASTITGVGTDFTQDDVGKVIRIADFSGNYTILSQRANSWNVYASETDNSAVGFFLAQIQAQQVEFVDSSPFADNPLSQFDITLQRPLRNDPPKPTRVMTVHKRRIFRRDESLPNFFTYTAYEEVKATGVGAPEECVPGTDDNTLSDIDNEQSYPDESRRIIGMVSHADALFIGTEKNVTPLFGESLDDFVLSQITTFSVGFGSPYAAISTPHGLVFLSYDRKVYLWPQQWIPFYAPEETTALIELSRPKRIDFQNINPPAMGSTWFAFFNYGKRNWLAIAFQDNLLAWHTWIFDFETKGWFELQRGVQSLAVFEVTPGVRALIGGGTDGNVYVLDDPSGFFTTTANFPPCTFRPSLIDFGQPDTKHMLLYVEFEVSNAALANDITVNYYLDPIDADNPGVPIKITMTKVRGANRYRGFFVGGSVCERVLMEFSVAASQNSGVLRSITLAAKPVSKLIL